MKIGVFEQLEEWQWWIWKLGC